MGLAGGPSRVHHTGCRSRRRALVGRAAAPGNETGPPAGSGGGHDGGRARDGHRVPLDSGCLRLPAPLRIPRRIQLQLSGRSAHSASRCDRCGRSNRRRAPCGSSEPPTIAPRGKDVESWWGQIGRAVEGCSDCCSGWSRPCPGLPLPAVPEDLPGRCARASVSADPSRTGNHHGGDHCIAHSWNLALASKDDAKPLKAACVGGPEIDTVAFAGKRQSVASGDSGGKRNCSESTFVTLHTPA
jgi:hypothetical protein